MAITTYLRNRTEERIAKDLREMQEQESALLGKFGIKILFAGEAFLQRYFDARGNRRIAAFSNIEDAELAARCLSYEERSSHYEGWTIVTFDKVEL